MIQTKWRQIHESFKFICSQQVFAMLYRTSETFYSANILLNFRMNLIKRI